jgi:autotransporter-associated beta strand protein
MPTWTATGNGTWTDPANWSGGVPAAAGSTAAFSFATNVGGTVIIGIPEFADISVGIMNITMTGTTGITIRGSLTDSGADIGDLIFDNSVANAQLNINTLATTSPTTFSSAAGLRMTLASDLLVNVVTAGSIARFDLPVSGAGTLIMSGVGTLELNSTNTFTGGIEIVGGILEASGDAALSSGAITISNAATFRSSGTINNTIGTLSNIAGTAGSAQIVAAAATTMTLSGTLSHISQGVVNFGSIADTGTIIASFGSIQENATNSFFRIAGGTVQMGNAFNAANLLSHPGAGLTEFQNGGILDTRGFATTISNLDFDDGTIRSSIGTLNLTVNDVFGATNAQNGTVEGTAGVDSLVINADFGFSLGSLSFASWTAGVDTITMNGSANSNTLTGSSQRETINGFDGTDLLFGGGGIDTINGGNGNDTIALSASGSFVDGGADIDTLQTTGAVSLGSVSGMEAISLIGGSTLTLTNAQFESGFSATSTLSGTGTIFVGIANSGSAQVVQARSMTTAVGATIVFTVNGSTGIDVIKGGLGTTNILNGNAGADQLVGGSLADTINGGTEADKIRGDGGADSLTGGAGADVFKFRNVSDSGIGASADTITDFVSGTDRLNFSRIDADPFTTGDQAFVFVDTVAFTNNGIAQIRWVDLGADLRVEADINGDGVADMQVLLQGAGAQVLSAADFVL